MKKSFLKTFIVLGLFSIFLCGSFGIAEAQYPGQWAANPEAYNIASDGTRASVISPGNQEDWFANSVQTIIMTALIYGSKWVSAIIAFTGKLFDYVLQYTTTYPTNLSQGIYGSWKIVRDFSNIILVFSLLYLGIRTIYEGQGFAEKKTLAGIILAAILINFSFFFVKDVAFNISNTVGLQVLQQAKVNSTNNSYSAGLMQIVSPQKVLSNNGFDEGWSGNAIAINERGDWNLIFTMAGQFVMFTAIVVALGFVFAGASMMLLYRFVIFVILMIGAPFGLISTQIPWLQKYGKDWLEHLKKQTLFFPAFTIVLYIVLYIVTALASSSTITSTLNTTNQSALFLFLFNFILIIFFMGALLVLPGKIGMAGSDLMTKSSGFLKNKIRNIPKRSGQLALSGGARTGRLVGGGLANAALKSDLIGKRLKIAAQNPDGGRVARALIRGGEGLKNSTFDIRNTKVGASLGMGKGIDSWQDKVNKNKKVIEERKKKEEEMFGFKKMERTPEQKAQDKAELAQKEGERNVQGALVKDIKENLKKAQLRGASISEIKTITDTLSKEEKTLEEKETAVGEAQNKGESEHLKLMQKRQKRLWGLTGISYTKRQALKKIEDDIKKSWKEAGKYKEEKKKKDTSTIPPSTSRPSSPTNYITLPPNLPPPTGL